MFKPVEDIATMRAVRWITVCLTAGVIFNIAIAWLCAGFINPTQNSNSIVSMTAVPGGEHVFNEQRRFGHTRINQANFSVLQMDPAGTTMLVARWAGDAKEISEDFAGWPMRCVHCTNRAEIAIQVGGAAMGMSKTGPGAIDHGYELGSWPGGPSGSTWRALPYQALWLGFTLNSIFYAVLIAIMGCALVVMRDRRRRQQGRCLDCGYDLTGAMHERCPECGRACPPQPIVVAHQNCEPTDSSADARSVLP
jgi:hypothetical protein